MGEISSTIFYSLFSLKFTDLINYLSTYLFICLFTGSFDISSQNMVKYHNMMHNIAIMHDYVIYQEPIR